MPEKQEEKNSEPLEKLLLDTLANKYLLIRYALRWAKELQKSQERRLSPNELINRALVDILSGKVKPDEIEKLLSLEREHLPLSETKVPILEVSAKVTAKPAKVKQKETKKGKK